MAKCIYCGEPAGLFRKRHPGCEEQYQNSIKAIPQFFSKVLHSSLAPERFTELLKNAALASYVSEAEFSKLALKGLRAMIDAALSQRLLTPEEEARAAEIAETLGISLVNTPELRDKLVKIRVLRDLDAGQIPDRVVVTGPIPLDLAEDEHILWIVNGAKAHRISRSKQANEPERFGAAVPGLLDYYAPGERTLSLAGLPSDGDADVVFTNHNVFVISLDRQRKMPISRITGLQTYANALQIVRRGRDERSIVISLDDPWFAANLLVQLIRLNGGRAEGDESEALDDESDAED